MANDGIDLEWLIRIRRGDGTADERAQFERWVNADSSRASLVDALGALDGTTPDQLRQWDTERGLARFKQLRSGGGKRRSTPRLTLSRPGPRSRLLPWALSGVAAVAVAVAVTAAPIQHDLRFGLHAPPTKGPREIITASGQRAVLDLSDGTHVVLSPESHLLVPANFEFPGSRRELSLEGEAFFSVRHDAARPFVVHTPQGIAEDLGTHFVISTYPEIQGTRLAVREGSVIVRTPRLVAAANTVALLGPGDIALLLATELRVKRNQDVSGFFAGGDGALVLNESLGAAIPRLERWFGVRVHVTNKKLLMHQIAAELRNATAAEGFAVIATSLNASATWHQNQVTLASVALSGENK
jgi:ferric-dicitrate binding protein FerR (iron transport regulator)